MELNINFNEKMLVETANRVLDEFEYRGKTIREWADLIANPKTNADRIRAMTDEELAIWIAHISACTWCPAKNIKTSSPCKGLYSGCKENWLDWMRQEAKYD